MFILIDFPLYYHSYSLSAHIPTRIRIRIYSAFAPDYHPCNFSCLDIFSWLWAALYM
ncbi:hypothetical protein AG1IA_04919 [Rhizoctonia solani AG-1 IA]|uniref:Uncharacterized protein n=1 Tax=Thanatephorus cucumeris (strain AG1-IA) TaxID=983506 RepID=L8WW50_THACA|nr:hypothetical protein AG1IA_04919 [Rhizoctonia solani AG-1 IA]